MRNAVWYKCPYQFFCGGARILKPTLYGYDTVANIRSENYLSAAKLVYPRSELFGLPTFTELVSRIAARIDIPFTVGGGIASVDDAGRLLEAGADKITVNSAAVANPSLIDAIAAKYGAQFIVAAIDARMIDGRWVVTTHGGSRPTDRELFSWATEVANRGAGEILFTSMDHDGTKNGYPCDVFARLAGLPVPIIASGGAGTIRHIADVLTIGHADAALAASIFHYGEIPIPTLKQELNKQGINIRL